MNGIDYRYLNSNGQISVDMNIQNLEKSTEYTQSTHTHIRLKYIKQAFNVHIYIDYQTD